MEDTRPVDMVGTASLSLLPYPISHGDNMSIFQRIKDFLFGYEFISSASIREMMEYIIEDVDTNNNGWISVNELIDGVKSWMKRN